MVGANRQMQIIQSRFRAGLLKTLLGCVGGHGCPVIMAESLSELEK